MHAAHQPACPRVEDCDGKPLRKGLRRRRVVGGFAQLPAALQTRDWISLPQFAAAITGPEHVVQPSASLRAKVLLQGRAAIGCVPSVGWVHQSSRVNDGACALCL